MAKINVVTSNRTQALRTERRRGNIPGSIPGSAKRLGGSGMRQKVRGNWEVRLGLGHVVVVWAVVAGTMFAVFLFGFYSGRDQGLSQVLSRVATPEVRLPIIGADTTALDLESPYKSIAVDEVSEAVKPLETATEPVADFTRQAKISVKKVEIPKEQVVPEVKIVEKKKPIQKPQQVQKAVTSADSHSEDLIKPGWYIQIATAKNRDQALEMSKNISQDGITPRIQGATRRGANFFRVIIGPYGSKQSATWGLESISKLKTLKGRPFIKEIK